MQTQRDAAMNLDSQQPGKNFHGGAIIDEQGREVPITEAMIQQAFQRLEKSGQPPSQPFTPAQKAGA
ncbi:MAG: PA1571 family protein [Alcanivorax jadensis]|uniref:PA1571 family protein n=1 Tax=Alcanivorax jadensis TaxID=64988 RepID=UPI00300228F2|tara:strand:- start:573 stop:773 length:201 start_codon:yes stop_codon:yes gene_type:complete